MIAFFGLDDDQGLNVISNTLISSQPPVFGSHHIILYADDRYVIAFFGLHDDQGLNLISGTLIQASLLNLAPVSLLPAANCITTTKIDNLSALVCLSTLDGSVTPLFDLDDDYGINIVLDALIPRKSLALRSRPSTLTAGVIHLPI